MPPKMAARSGLLSYLGSSSIRLSTMIAEITIVFAERRKNLKPSALKQRMTMGMLIRTVPRPISKPV